MTPTRPTITTTTCWAWGPVSTTIANQANIIHSHWLTVTGEVVSRTYGLHSAYIAPQPTDGMAESPPDD